MTVELTTDQVAELLLPLAREVTAHNGQWDEHVHDDVEWSITDFEPLGADHDWDDERIELHGRVPASFQVKTLRAKRNPPGKAHPAEYETRETLVGVTITYNYTEPVGQRIFVRAELEGESPEPSSGSW